MADDELRTVAQQILDNALPEERTIGALVDALKQATRRLQRGLEPLLGSLGVRLILVQAIHRAAKRHPFLEGITIYEDGIEADDILVRKSDADYDEVRRACEDLLGTFLEVLAELVGEDLTITLVREVSVQLD